MAKAIWILHDQCDIENSALKTVEKDLNKGTSEEHKTRKCYQSNRFFVQTIF